MHLKSARSIEPLSIRESLKAEKFPPDPRPQPPAPTPMATIAQRFSNPGGAESSVTIEKATPAQQRLGLAVLLTGKARPHDSTVEQFLAFVHQQKMTIDELYI